MLIAEPKINDVIQGAEKLRDHFQKKCSFKGRTGRALEGSEGPVLPLLMACVGVDPFRNDIASTEGRTLKSVPTGCLYRLAAIVRLVGNR